MLRLMMTLVTIGLLAMACNDNANSESNADRKNGFTPTLKTREDSLFHDVMAGHDAGMAKISKLGKSTNETTRLLDSLGKLPAKKVNAAYKQSLTDLQAALNKAHDEMFNWMNDFKADSLTDNKELRIKYLQLEKEKVAVVKELILSSLQQADSLLNK